MSYNVTGFTIKKLDSFTLPYTQVLKMAEGELTDKDGILTFDSFYAESMEIIGTRDGDRLCVIDLHYGSEGSGTYWDAFEELLKASAGTLKARVVWEGGDSVEIITIINGTVVREDV